MKNPNLCQKPFCREPYTKLISGWDSRRGGSGWSLKVCDLHAEAYEKAVTTPQVRIDKRKEQR